MAKPIVSDDLWTVVAPLLPPEPPKPKGGRPRLPDRAALTGIIFVLRTGIPWEWLPQEMGCGSGMTCWRRLRAWQQAGVWHRLHRVILDRLGDQDQIDWSRASLDSTSVRAKKGVPKPGRTRPIGASQAPNVMCWSKARAFRSPIRSRRRT
jgi:transposase